MNAEPAHSVNESLARLTDAWCEGRELRPLALILPAYTANNGLADGWAALMEALHDLRASGGLHEAEQAEVEHIVPIVEQMVYRP